MKICRNIILILGWIILAISFFTPFVVSLFFLIGVNIGYLFLLSMICFIISIILTVQRRNNFIMVISIIGMFLSMICLLFVLWIWISQVFTPLF